MQHGGCSAVRNMTHLHLVRSLLLVAVLAGCNSGADADGSQCAPFEPPALAGTCSRALLLDAECTCGGESFDPAQGVEWACAGSELVDKAAPVTPELCNGLDDDGDGQVADDEACLAQCDAAAVESAKDALVLPTDQDITTAGGAPKFIGLLTEVPAWCDEPVASSDPDELWIGCGEIVDATGPMLMATSIRVAPGGVLRLTGDVTLDAGEILVCPNGLVQGRAGSADAPGPAAQIEATTWLHYGVLDTAGGTLRVDVDRALIAGTVSTSHTVGRGPETASGPAAGDAELHVTTELFFSGEIATAGGDGSDALGCGMGGNGGDAGNMTLDFPVCCHGGVFAGSGGTGGKGGVGEDGNEGRTVELAAGSVASGSLCDGEDEFTIEALCAVKVALDFDPDPGEDLDLVAFDASGAVAAASLGIEGHEEIELPGGARYRIVVRAYGPEQSTGRYTVSAQ